MLDTKNCQEGNGSSQVDFRVNRIQSPEKNRRIKTSVIFGLNVGGCCASYDPGPCYLKTSQDYLLPMEDGFSTECYRTFTAAGMMRNGKLYPLRNSALHTFVKGFGLYATKIMNGETERGHYWRTPDANMERGNRSYKNMKMRLDKGKPLNLNDQINAINKGLLPTPQARDFRSGSSDRVGRDGYQNNLNDVVKLWPTPRNNTGPSADKKHMSLDGAVKIYPTPTVNGNNNERGSSPKAGDGLATAVKRELWGTPTANDTKNAITESQRGRGTLTAHIVEKEGEHGGQLNPDWVEGLMGYPLGWTDISRGTITEINYFEAWANGAWENGMPPITKKKKNRKNRLKCLGNAVVPEIPAIIIQLIMRVLWLQ